MAKQTAQEKQDMVTQKPLFDQLTYLTTWLYGIKRKEKLGLLLAMRRDASATDMKKSYVFPAHVMVMEWRQGIRTQMHIFRKGIGVAYHGMEPIRLSFTCILPHFENLNGLNAFYEMLNNVFSEEGGGYANYVFGLNVDDISLVGYLINYGISGNEPNVLRINFDMVVSAFHVRGGGPAKQVTMPDKTVVSVIHHPAMNEITPPTRDSSS